MDDTLQKALRKATQNARHLLEDEFEEQLDGRFDIRPDGTISDEPGPHLDAEERLLREKLVTAIGHREAGGMSAEEAVAAFLREAAFTTLNRFVALKMLEERGVVKESISEGQQSSGFKEFTMLAPGLSELSDGGYRLYLESLFDEIGQEVKVLFDRDVVAGRLWPRRPALEDLLEILNKDALADAWQETEAIGWVYQYFNADSEREEMREESSTPRNSHELAVRNQFFTPHYVVQFLTDNTLGRTWHEMHEGDTRILEECDYFAERADEVFLDEGEAPPESSSGSSNVLGGADENGESDVPGEASHEEDDEGPTYVPYRAKKDPRELKILDPACGSGHFLLYAFDLLWTIYEEAWEDPEAPVFEETGCTLSEDYESLEDLHSALPGLILEKNLYGVDIDPRATQIASFALWMRAQEAYSEVGLARDERPAITKTNVVVAEPMPGDEELREEFVESLQPPALGQLVDAVFEKMELADEAGTLLRIEEEIRDAIQEAKKQWEQPKQLELLPEETRQEFRQAGLFDVSNISDEEFWSSVEEQIYRALEDYAEQGEQQDGLRRRLFVDDTAAGFAFLDLCRQRYDSILMNPPFGEPVSAPTTYSDNTYEYSKDDILQSFIERSEELLNPSGYVGAITNKTPFFNKSSESWRKNIILNRFKPYLFSDLGYGVLDAKVETAAYILRSLSEKEREEKITEIIPYLKNTKTNSKGKFSVPKYMRARGGNIKRSQAERELRILEEKGVISDVSGRYPQFTTNKKVINRKIRKEIRTVGKIRLRCFRVLDYEDKAGVLAEATSTEKHPCRFDADPDTFENVPGAPFAYWVTDRVRQTFRELPAFESRNRDAQHGLSTKHDFRFLRTWWEVSPGDVCPPDPHPSQWNGRYCVLDYKWYPFAKGGINTAFYSDVTLVVNWLKEGQELEADLLRKYSYLEGDANWVLHRECDYYRDGITWSRRPYDRGFFAFLPRGCIFSDVGPTAFAESASYLCSVLNSDSYLGLLHLLMPRGGVGTDRTLKYEVGYVTSVPIPNPGSNATQLRKLSTRGYYAARGLYESEETSKAFRGPAPLITKEGTLEESINSYVIRTNKLKKDLVSIKEKIDKIVDKKYGIENRNESGVLKSLVGEEVEESEEGKRSTSLFDNTIDKEKIDYVKDLLSYVVGVVFGRWGKVKEIKGGEKDDEESIFEPIKPGTPDNEAINQKPSGKTSALGDNEYQKEKLLVDDKGNEIDILHKIREVLGFIYSHPSSIEEEAATLLGEKNIRKYFRKASGFFEDHRKKYSNSQRKAPIYWQLALQSTDYSIWLYYPKLTQDTFYRVLDLVKDKIRHEERQLSDLRQEAGETPSSTKSSEIADQDDLVSELRGFRKEVERVAPLWNPDMNDGVVINYAPLWRLVQHNRSWQKECKKHWDRLVDGEYDWSHWAMHLWPERVVPKCAERRDLAIAHDLEEVFWEQDAEGDWTARDEPARPVEELVEERTSQTVKSALEDLLNAPAHR